MAAGDGLVLGGTGQQISFSYAQSQSWIRTSQVMGGMEAKKDVFLTSALAD
jgi:hypothetical protein